MFAKNFSVCFFLCLWVSLLVLLVLDGISKPHKTVIDHIIIRPKTLSNKKICDTIHSTNETDANIKQIINHSKFNSKAKVTKAISKISRSKSVVQTASPKTTGNNLPVKELRELKIIGNYDAQLKNAFGIYWALYDDDSASLMKQLELSYSHTGAIIRIGKENYELDKNTKQRVWMPLVQIRDLGTSEWDDLGVAKYHAGTWQLKKANKKLTLTQKKQIEIILNLKLDKPKST